MKTFKTRTAASCLILITLSACEQHQAAATDTPAPSESAGAQAPGRTNDSQVIPLESLLAPAQQQALSVADMTDDRREILRSALANAYFSGFAAASKAHGSPTATETFIVGSFNGWDGQTIVRLGNGEIWHQTDLRIEYQFRVMPRVTFHASGDQWKMKVEGTQEPVSVERLK